MVIKNCHCHFKSTRMTHRQKQKKFSFSLKQPGTLLHVTKTDLLQKELNRHNHNRKGFNLQALHGGKQLLKQACSMQINQIFHAALRKTNSIHKAKAHYKHFQSLGRFKARVSWGKERQHTYFWMVEQVLYNTEVCCVGASKETCTMATPLRCWTHLHKIDGAFNPPQASLVYPAQNFRFSSPQTAETS